MAVFWGEAAPMPRGSVDHEPSHCRHGVWLHASRMFGNDAQPESRFHEIGSAGRNAGHCVRAAWAEAKTSLGQNCRTPCQFRVQPASEFSVTLTLSGYQPQTVSVRPEADGAVAMPRLAPNPVHVDLQAVAPPKKPVPKKKRPAEATGGDAAGRAPSPLAETAPSATNYPWSAR